MRGIVFLLGVLVFTGCERTEPPAADQAVRPAKLFRVSEERASVVHQFVGRVDAAQTLDVSFEIDGALLILPIREGEAIAKGAVVAALDPRDFELAVQEAQVQLRLATQDMQRKQTLLRERGIAQSAVDDAEAQFELSEVRLSQARERLAKSRITAPFDAYVARRYVDNRTRIRAGDKIARLSDLNELKVIASVSEQLIATVTPEAVVSLTARFDFLPERAFPLTFLERSGEANPVAQTYEVTFSMARPTDVTLLPGMTAQVRVELQGGSSSSGILIPTTALLSAPDGSFFVWLFDPASSQVSRRTVTVGHPGMEGVQISSGLADGDLVVAAGASQLQDGMQVRMMGEPAIGIGQD